MKSSNSSARSKALFVPQEGQTEIKEEATDNLGGSEAQHLTFQHDATVDRTVDTIGGNKTEGGNFFTQKQGLLTNPSNSDLQGHNTLNSSSNARNFKTDTQARLPKPKAGQLLLGSQQNLDIKSEQGRGIYEHFMEYENRRAQQIKQQNWKEMYAQHRRNLQINLRRQRNGSQSLIQLEMPEQRRLTNNMTTHLLPR